LLILRQAGPKFSSVATFLDVKFLGMGLEGVDVLGANSWPAVAPSSTRNEGHMVMRTHRSNYKAADLVEANLRCKLELAAMCA